MIIRVVAGKGGKDRDLPLSPARLETLREYWECRKPKLYMFPTHTRGRTLNQPISDKSVWIACSEAARRAGINKRVDWVVYLKPPFGGPQHVLRYLAGYTHLVAISNHRLVAFDHNQVTFRYKDYAHGNKKRLMTLSAQEFLRRFLLHVLPRGFVRIRFYGFLANRRRANLLPLCQQLLLLHHPDTDRSPGT